MIDPVAATLIGTGIGAIAGVSGTIATAWFAQRGKDKEQLRRLAYLTGVKSWELHQKIAERRSQRGVRVYLHSLESYVLNSLLFLRFAEKADGMTKEDLLVGMKEIDEIAAELAKSAKERSDRERSTAKPHASSATETPAPDSPDE